MAILRHPAAIVKELLDPIEETVVCRSRLRLWAVHNAYTLIFLAACFVITWTIQILMVILEVRK